MVEPEVYREMGLNDAEYAQILGILGREPTLTELGMFAVMWSEHCGYKYSRPVLSLFRTYREARDKGLLENAGVVPLDERLGIVFKIESHNHPSAVEPFQGAATGVGGILRDVFTMGARPIASLNSLRFGPLEEPRNRYLFEHVVAGIAHYGNCVGVPTVAGEIYFHPCYSGNPLVNAMAVGVVERDRIASAAARGVGNPVLYVGSATGKDGIHGATFASAELDENSESKRPNVQMGDPFLEKLLIEATLEALATGHVIGIQDMGAAGLTCSTCETASKAGTGIEIDVRRVPLREPDMTPYEIMLSESQERMLCILRRGTEQAVMEIFRKWGLNAAVIGQVTDDGMVRVRDNGVVVAEVPARALTEECPTYYLETQEPEYIRQLQSVDVLAIAGQDVTTSTDVLAPILADLPEGREFQPVHPHDATLLRLLDTPSIASKEWATEQYDSMVQAQTVALNGADAAVLRIHGTSKGIALKIDGNGRYGYLDPYVGGQIAVAEAARNVACVGARPVALTDNLNFANPQKPDNFYQFRRSVEGIAHAAEVLETPVVSGNVSFYNETPEGPIFPTPTIGMLGILDDVNRRCQAGFRPDGEGDLIVLLSAYEDPTGGLGGSEYLALVHHTEAGPPPRIDVAGEKRLQQLLLQSIQDGLFASCHDVSDGGLAVCLAESAIWSDTGAAVLLNPNDFPASLPVPALLFGEAQGRVVVTLRTEKQFATLRTRAQQQNIRALWIGTVGGTSLRIALGPTTLLDLPVSLIAGVYRNALPRRMHAPSPQNRTGETP
ncbi:MAG: phosphoribosylformylglycinamidine synthase subunit PurL [Chloroherpetonaceae bacterium]|nr:phosphoribosylformylglycinamidine synthase subunit PurL [Chthonomonadaceae bacterium]MDW8209245.1 phosphoribosylformylglycinamidine synthase subunit PurL [Chloroherpetonaceae bacterium]